MWNEPQVEESFSVCRQQLLLLLLRGSDRKKRLIHLSALFALVLFDILIIPPPRTPENFGKFFIHVSLNSLHLQPLRGLGHSCESF